MLTLIAIAHQINELSDGDTFRPANFFSFFTIQSNLIAAAVLLWGATRDPVRRHPATVDLIRGAATLYLSITGLGVAFLLSGRQEDLQTAVPWVDAVVHPVIPIVMAPDWLIVPPTTRIPFRRALSWLAYPLLYSVYTLIRGPIVDWRPYPFLDPDRAGGSGAVALYRVGIAAGSARFIWLVVAIGDRMRLVAART